MRTLLLSACLSFFSSMLFAQVPQAIKYQAVARDTAGGIMANANITVRVSIIDSAAGGGVVYSENTQDGDESKLYNLICVSYLWENVAHGSFRNRIV